MLTLDHLGISEEDWNQTPTAVCAWRWLRAGSLSWEQFQQETGPIQTRVRELFQQGAACDQAKTRRKPQ